MPRSRKNSTAALVIAVVASAAVIAAMTALPLAAQENDEPPPITVEPLTTAGHNVFPDDVAFQVREKPAGRSRQVVNLRDGSHLATLKITIQPGAMFPWHTHPGPVLAAVAEGDESGAFVFVYADDCVQRPYQVGEAFVDPGGGNVHTAFNPSASKETVVIATFLGVPEAATLTVPIDHQPATTLNHECGLEAPIPTGHAH